ncbi:uncharacterized protein LOC144378022 isoform X6 [Ictidomys tridecemlineatus]
MDGKRSSRDFLSLRAGLPVNPKKGLEGRIMKRNLWNADLICRTFPLLMDWAFDHDSPGGWGKAGGVTCSKIHSSKPTARVGFHESHGGKCFVRVEEAALRT